MPAIYCSLPARGEPADVDDVVEQQRAQQAAVLVDERGDHAAVELVDVEADRAALGVQVLGQTRGGVDLVPDLGRDRRRAGRPMALANDACELSLGAARAIHGRRRVRRSCQR